MLVKLKTKSPAYSTMSMPTNIIHPGVSRNFEIANNPIADTAILIVMKIEKLSHSGLISLAPKNPTAMIVSPMSNDTSATRILNRVRLLIIYSFNPCWVFWYVATYDLYMDIMPKVQFQSLLGFLIRCDTERISVEMEKYSVSIPVGFSDTLRPRGFADPAMMSCFNPCWVFWYVATFSEHISGACPSCFNPCWVFWYVATTTQYPALFWGRGVSIPVGFSDTLRHIPPYIVNTIVIGFNPCWVFWYVATFGYMYDTARGI